MSWSDFGDDRWIDGMDIHVRMAAFLLLIYGTFQALFALFCFAGGIFIAVAGPPPGPDDPPNAFSAVMFFVFGLIVLLFSAPYWFGGIGLLQRSKVGWILALVGFALWMSSCCMPVGLYGFFALLRDPVRKAYLA